MGNKKKSYPLLNKVHHVGIVVRDIEKSAKLLENYGLSRSLYPSLPGWLEKLLFHYKPFDREFKFFGIGPFIHPALFKILEWEPIHWTRCFHPSAAAGQRFMGNP
jgi:hypothetical protein